MFVSPHPHRATSPTYFRYRVAVAPHQPRVDFQLWFHGLAVRSVPAYVATLLDRLCHNAEAVQPLFADALPPQLKHVRFSSSCA